MDAIDLGVRPVSQEDAKRQFAQERRYKDHLARNRFMSEEFRTGLRRYRNSHLRDKDNEATVKDGARCKIIVSGPNTEVYRYEVPVRIGKRPLIFDAETGEILNRPTMHCDVDEDGNLIKRERKEEAKRTNARRSKMELRRLVLSNFANRDKFLTLTFRDGAVPDVTSVSDCNKAFDRFLKRLRRSYPDVKYCRVIEFQDTNGRGAVHYHCILTLPYVPYDKLSELWGNGFVGINAIDHVDNVGAYVQKYMAKDFDDARLAGKKAYTVGGDLTRPIVLYGDEADEVYNDFLADKLPTYSNEYPSEWQGKIKYEEYNAVREANRLGN